MKKVFMSLAAVAFIAAGSLTVTSCGSDDSTPDPVNPVPAGLKLALITDANEIYAQEPFELSIKDADGNNISGAILLANGEETDIESVDGVFKLNGPEGDWTFSASYDGKTSNEIDVTIKPSRAVSEGTGVITYNGGTMDIDESYIVFRGLFYKSQTDQTVIASWQIESYSGNTAAIVRFTTPTTPAGGDQYTYELPTATNTTGTLAAVLIGNNVDGQTNENVSVDFGTTTYADRFFNGKYIGGAPSIDGKALSVEFEGKTPRVDAKQKAGKNTISFTDAKKTISVKSNDIKVLETSL